MRIGIDGYNLAMANGTGIATYSLMLAKTLQSMQHHVDGVFGLDVTGPADERETLFYDRLARPGDRGMRRKRLGRILSTLGTARGLEALPVPAGTVDTRALRGRMAAFDTLSSGAHVFERSHAYFRATGRFARLRMENPPEIMHWTYPVPVVLEDTRNIYTLHDMVPLRLPFATLDDKRFYRSLVAGCAARADAICTVSETSRRDIVDLLGVAPDRVVNTYQVSPMDPDLLDEHPDASAHTIQTTFGLPRDGYFLFFGAIEPKKNLGRLIEAYLSLDTKTPLVIVAARSWQSEAELVLLPRTDDVASPRHAHLEQRIIQIDYLPRHLLMRLLRGARALAFPSLYEGFGLPVHEAMLLGVPVLSSLTGSVPEIAGDAALLVDPYDVAAIAAGLRRLDADADLRADLAVRGVAQAERFSSERYKQALDALYQRVLETPR
ncbi:glycosyltransferase [Sphingomonas sp. PAMC 26621]|uniref:glycosyltransferase n=1 Tax=Sphingomonas sp. PAMC 26621 TaxID=1112213 RepID=UPI0002895309|nr:glycosyltransferase [Sphingomonas sp. PAMC 26621]